MARLRTRWNQSERERNYADVGGALAMSTWKLAAESLLNLENEGFETRTNAQRLEVLAEFLAYAVHLIDRLAYDRCDDARRGELVTALAARLNEIINDNRAAVGAVGGIGFVELANRRSGEYADCNFSPEEGPGFTMRRILGEHVRRVMGDKDAKWIPSYVLDAEAPGIYAGLKRAARLL